MTVKLKLIYLICLILCVFITFSTVNATDLSQDLALDDSDGVAIISQSESSLTNLNENSDNAEFYNEDEDCVDSMNELSNSNQKNIEDDQSNSLLSNDDLDSINSDEISLKSGLGYANSDINSDSSSKNSLGANNLKESSYGFNDLQNLINGANANSIINLEGKTFIGNGSFVKIDKALTINGGSKDNMATLDAKNLSSILLITSNNVHLLNCNFINGLDNSVLIKASNCSISNSNFRDNYHHLRVMGNNENFTLQYCNFTGGYLNESSSVVITVNKSYISYCNFINNTVKSNADVQGHGAALQIGTSYTSLSLGFIDYCNFINNTVITNSDSTHAGALCFRPGIVVRNSNFINNYCNRMGGATSLHSDGEIINCTFINNSAGEYGGAICTGLSTDDISVNITNCIFINNSAPMGGAIQIKGHNVRVTNSKFEDNKANESEGGAVFIVGNSALIINSTFNDNFAKTFGAGILINGSDASILNSSFDSNVADFGAAVYVIGPDANLFSSNFTNHDVKNGSVYIKGINTYVYDSNFLDNFGEAGAGLFIQGSNTTLISSNFSSNNASKKGGAIFIEGSNAKLILSNFLNNNAIPSISELDDGLGGAIYIKGDNNLIDSSIFNFNTARNGSAIYTDGLKMTLSNTDFDKNQAWSYVLNSSVNPSSSYFNQSDILIELTLIGGNNIANAIYNTASMDEIYFYNVSYISSKGKKVTGDEEIHPVDGAQNSNNGSLLYQDDREDNQLVNVIIYKDLQENGKLLSASSMANVLAEGNDFNGQIILNKTFTTGILGDIGFNLSDYIDEPLEPGKYHLYAEHFEDDYYKEIDETNEFDIVPILDLSIDIGSSRVNIDFNKTVKYTIKVQNNGPNDATGVNVNAVIPEGLIYLSSSPSIGSYDSANGIWTIGNLDSGDNQTLIINVQTNKTGLIDFPVNVSSIEDDSNFTNNYDNKTIRVLMADLAIDVEASDDNLNYGDTVDWTVTVVNNGPNNASNLIVILDLDDGLVYLDSSNDTFNQSNNQWEIPNLLVGDEINLIISTKVNTSNNGLNLKANVSADTFDSIPSNNFDLDTVNVLPLCDLITKVSVSDDEANKDDIVDWIVVVSNDGPDSASDVSLSLSDLESLGLVVVGSSDDSFDEDVCEWFIGDLGAGESVSLTITTQINKSDDNISIVGEAETSTMESDYENNIDNESLAINPLCDVRIDIEVSNSIINNGDAVDWIVVVSNDGPDSASDVSLSLSDLESLGLVVVGSSDDSFDEDACEWFIGDLDAGESVSLTLTTKANRSDDDIVLVGKVETSTFELNEDNNEDNESLEVLPVCDLVISISPDNNPVNVGETVNWIINVTNNGPDKASDVNVANSLPEGLEFIVHDSNKGDLEEITDEEGNVIDFIWKVGDLESNESALLIISTNALEEGSVLNNASVNSSTTDINQSNNFDSSELDIISSDDSDNNQDDNPDSSDNADDNNDSESDEYDDEGFPWYDYFPDDQNNNSGKNLDKSKNNYGDNSKMSNKNDSIMPIDLSNKKTGNPLVFVVLSIFALFLLGYRKN